MTSIPLFSTKAIFDRGATGIGLDADPNMIARAREQFPELTFLVADVRAFDLVDGPVDAIFSNAALHWVKDANQAVAAMSRALKPGGRFVVEFGGKGNVQRIVQATLETLGRRETDNPWFYPSIAEYATLLENNGIEVISAALFDRPTILKEGDEGMKNWLRMFGGLLFQDLPETEVENVLQKVDEKLRLELWDGQKWTADYRRIRIVGKKGL